jgi:hypothetical protein
MAAYFFVSSSTVVSFLDSSFPPNKPPPRGIPKTLPLRDTPRLWEKDTPAEADSERLLRMSTTVERLKGFMVHKFVIVKSAGDRWGGENVRRYEKIGSTRGGGMRNLKQK